MNTIFNFKSTEDMIKVSQKFGSLQMCPNFFQECDEDIARLCQIEEDTGSERCYKCWMNFFVEQGFYTINDLKDTSIFLESCNYEFRLLGEFIELVIRLGKLKEYIPSKYNSRLKDYERKDLELLKTQYNSMKEYGYSLLIRLEKIPTIYNNKNYKKFYKMFNCITTEGKDETC